MKIQNIEDKLSKLKDLVANKIACERALKDISNIKNNRVSVCLKIGCSDIEYPIQKMKTLIETELKNVIKKDRGFELMIIRNPFIFLKRSGIVHVFFERSDKGGKWTQCNKEFKVRTYRR